VAPSEAARRATGAKAVAEPSALLASGEGRLKVAKRKMGNVTVAIAESPRLLSLETDGREDRTGATKGAIYIVGTGPGSIEHLTPRAFLAIRRSDVIVGYPTYLNLIRGLIIGKEIVSTGMAREIDRCTKAIELAGRGKRVSVISGGDPGIYAMAGLIFDLLREKKVPLPDSVSVEVIPGISALNACAARLGAPLMHDFAVVSLSDRLTPWETIARRLDAAAGTDFVIVLYNPKSASRRKHIRKAQEILLRHRPGSTPVGIVKGATRQDEAIILSDLDSMPFDKIDMQTTVIIGNSQSVVWNGRMITPRGYENKEAW
jgi:precorrin-3B C17-methyltransferase